MCGIVGYCGKKNAAEILVEGLRRLEYRGYDSAGISILNENKITTIKKKGKIRDLKAALPENIAGNTGIGHTRWATHGEVNDINAHPHNNSSNTISIVHNGIIENYQALRSRLEKQGCKFITETDSEVVAHLVSEHFQGDLENAVKQAVSLLQGTYGIVCVQRDNPGLIIGARNGSPLVLGVGDGEMFLASDVTAVMMHTKQVAYIEDGEVVRVTAEGFRISDLEDRNIQKSVETIDWELQEIEKGDFPTFMEKEIFEQPESILRAFRGRIDKEYATAKLSGLNLTNTELLNIQRVKIVAAGTSYHAALVGAYLLEGLARVPAEAELASETRYKNPIVERGTIYFAVSQSGETADTLHAMRELQRKGAKVLGICNVVGSTIARESDGGVYIHSGPEIAVASTKAFTSQIAVFYLFTLLMARMRNMSYEKGLRMINEIQGLPDKIQQILGKAEEIRKLACKYADSPDFLFLGRGINYPVAMEGALKLKEISYIHAEGYSSAEIKHGPIALINEQTPSMFLVTDDRLRDKIISNIKEIKARKGKVIAVCIEGDTEIEDIADDVIYIPATYHLLYPFLMVIPLQLFSYYSALKLGRNVDQPRNLAKSVTVE